MGWGVALRIPQVSYHQQCAPYRLVDAHDTLDGEYLSLTPLSQERWSSDREGLELLTMSVTTLLVLLAGLLIAAKCVGWIWQRICIPMVLGQLVVGVLAGPSVLNWLHPDPLVNSFSTIGLILLMFIAGMETDTKQMRQVGVAAFVSASAGVVIPFVAGTAFSYALGYSLPMSLFLGTLLTATSVSISAQTLKELGKLHTKEGTTILGAAGSEHGLRLIVPSPLSPFFPC